MTARRLWPRGRSGHPVGDDEGHRTGLGSSARRTAIAAGTALLASSCGVVGGGGRGGFELTAYFPRAVALYKSSDVRILGLVAGEVTGVEAAGRRVKVTLRLADDTPVPRDVQAMIVPQSLIGERYVQLFPAWKQGELKAPSGTVIPESRTSVPVEPDEALAALKKFLDTLDPKATGKVVHNLSSDLKGAGNDLNGALKGLADLSATVAAKDDGLGRIIEHLDGFTGTLRTREAQLGKVMDSFAQFTSLLAEERRSIEGLLRGLGQVSGDTLDLVSEHGARLDRDLQVLTRTLATVDANMQSVRQVLDAGPLLVSGIQSAYDPMHHRLDLRTQASPAAQQALNAVLGPLGVPLGDSICLPIDVSCVANPSTSPAGPGTSSTPSPTVPPLPVVAPPVGASTTPTLPALPPTTVPAGATTTTVGPLPTALPTPIDTLLDLFGSGRFEPAAIAAGASQAERVAGGLGAAGRFIRRSMASLLGAGR